MGTTILLGIISIGILIFVHELGHFLSASACGIKVEVFSIGWGKGLLSFRWRETKIQIGWIPFGGYCKLAGDSPRDDLKDKPYEYYSSSPYKRILVALGGPAFNYLLSIVLFTLIIVVGYVIQTYPNRIILAKATDLAAQSGQTPAQKAGLEDGDVIIEINGTPVKTWDDITEHIVRNALKPVELTILRDGRTLRTSVVPELERETGRGLIGIQPWVEPVVGKVLPGEPAAQAGFKPGDRILSVNGESIPHYVAFYRAIEGKSGKKVSVVIQRDGRELTLGLIPELADGHESAGLEFQQITYESQHYPIPIAFARGFMKSTEAVRDTVRGIYLVFSGKIQARKAVAGPARIIYLSGVIAKEGFVYFLQVMSYISIAFFIMNLIPFPALDGSHIVISLYEIVARKKPNLEVVHRIQTFGFLFLIMVLIFVTLNDISSFFTK
jgi:regulator of sigma E protease